MRRLCWRWLTQTPPADPTTVVEPTADVLPRCCHCQRPCSAVNNPLKRRLPLSCSLTEEPSKKLFSDEDLSLYGYTPVTANSLQPTPTQTPHANPTTVVEPTADVLPKCCHFQRPCSAVNNPLKRRSPLSYSLTEEPSKKLFSDEDLSLHGYTPVPIPFNLDFCPYRPSAPTPLTPAERGSGLPPLPSLTSEETAVPDSVKLRRMNEQLEKECIAAEDDNVLPLDEGVHVEWDKKCVSIKFECPCPCAKVLK
ncbi:hypothetical protein V8G54_001233 [Vigna mungo]|uniref:Uncharacterized protein n=1 Tax=Vigna mungo TaxID=3915 RepID=A0AAQ3S806_VIGMU